MNIPVQYSQYIHQGYENMRAIRGHFWEEQNGKCCLCGWAVPFGSTVLHHNHLTGEIFGIAHHSCNVREGMGRPINVRRTK